MIDDAPPKLSTLLRRKGLIGLFDVSLKNSLDLLKIRKLWKLLLWLLLYQLGKDGRLPLLIFFLGHGRAIDVDILQLLFKTTSYDLRGIPLCMKVAVAVCPI